MQSLALALAELDADGRGDGGGDRQLVVVGARGGAPAASAAATATCCGAQQHLGAHVLDRLEAADRLAELLAHLRVLGGGVQRPARHPGGLGGQHRRGQVLEPSPRHGAAGGRRATSASTRASGREKSVAVQRLDRHTVGGGVDQHDVRRRPAAAARPAGSAPSTYSAVPGYPAVVVTQVGAQRHPGGALARGQRLEQLGRIGDHQRGQRRRGDRTGNQRARRPRRPSRTGPRRMPPAPPASSGTATPKSPSSARPRVDADARRPVSPCSTSRTAAMAPDRRGPAADQLTRGKLFVGDGRRHRRLLRSS